MDLLYCTSKGRDVAFTDGADEVRYRCCLSPSILVEMRPHNGRNYGRLGGRARVKPVGVTTRHGNETATIGRERPWFKRQGFTTCYSFADAAAFFGISRKEADAISKETKVRDDEALFSPYGPPVGVTVAGVRSW